MKSYIKLFLLSLIIAITLPHMTYAYCNFEDLEKISQKINAAVEKCQKDLRSNTCANNAWEGLKKEHLICE